ncbi:MAG: PAS domain S-box protein [Deltaproteobacteria bacterium]|nr:PAS domain S-box protein [Deltaproteobacteria bacterium]
MKPLLNIYLPKFWENIIENSPDAIVAVRKGGEIIIFNQAAERMLGYRKGDVIGWMDIRTLYPPGEAKQIMKDLRSSNYGGPGFLEKREFLLIDKNGWEIPVYISAVILYERGEEIGSVGIFTDLREKKELEKKLLRTEKLSSLGKLAAGIAHEINQPLTGVLTFAHMLHKKFQADEATKLDLEVVIRETTRIKKIVQGILDFGRETPMQKQLQPIGKILDATLELLVHQERFFGINLIKQYDPNIPEIVVDGSRLEQVFMNIILNAVEAMKGSGTLTVRTRPVAHWVEVDLSDTGPGIPEVVQEKIFDPFFTTKDSTEGLGMGLGLAISYGIIKNHKGDIKVSSAPDGGTTFTIRLPLPEK